MESNKITLKYEGNKDSHNTFKERRGKMVSFIKRKAQMIEVNFIVAECQNCNVCQGKFGKRPKNNP